jgi:hypothetical protein
MIVMNTQMAEIMMFTVRNQWKEANEGFENSIETLKKCYPNMLVAK